MTSLRILEKLNGKIKKSKNDTSNVVNLCWPHPITIIELACIVREAIIELTRGRLRPKVEVIDKKLPILHTSGDAEKVRIDMSKLEKLLGPEQLKNPRESIISIVRERVARSATE